MYPEFLTIHSWLRWATLLLAIGATLNAFRPDPDLTRRPPGARWDTLFMLAVDLQVLFGLILYFGLSPFTLAAFDDPAAAMRNPGVRFWAVEHVALMVAAVVLVRVGRILSLSAPSPGARRRRRLACFTVATLVMLAAVPWPGLSHGRPLFRDWPDAESGVLHLPPSAPTLRDASVSFVA